MGGRKEKMKDQLPELPEPYGAFEFMHDARVYTADQMRAYAREALTQAAADAQRWRFYTEHAQSYYKGRRLGEWLQFDGVMEHGSRNAAIDEAMRQGAQPPPIKETR
jgi:hypothetical protein